ncbi:hypothetical protein AWP89_00680, partial [Escherichia coli]
MHHLIFTVLTLTGFRGVLNYRSTTPHCGVKAGAQWIQYLLSLVPDCPWQHIVFTLPCQYWSLVFHNWWLLAEMSR